MPSLRREDLPWIAGALIVVLAVLLLLWLLTPQPNPLQGIYGIM